MLCHVVDNARDLGSVSSGHVKFALSPARNERVEVRRAPLGRIVAVGKEKLGMHLVRLEIADIEDPQVCCIAVYSCRQLLECLVVIALAITA